MYVSLNEIDNQIRKAARGAGLAWGEAEEAGKAARRLAHLGLDVLPAFAKILEAHADGEAAAFEGTAPTDFWRGAGGRPLSPLVLGPAISDNAFRLASGAEIAAGPVLWPALLGPFALRAAQACGRALEVATTSGSLIAFPEGSLGGEPEAVLAAESAPEVRCRAIERACGAPPSRTIPAGVRVDPEVWERLEHLARLTHVPASETSRQRGAGAGAIDND